MALLKQIGIGFGVFFASLIVELIVSLPFNPANLLLELGLAAPVMLGLTYLLATALKTASAAEGLLQGGLWALVVAAMYAFIGLGGQGTAITVPTFYVLVACIAVGPALAGRAATAGGRAAVARSTTIPTSPASATDPAERASDPAAEPGTAPARP